jgi:hypothetical protein
MRRQGGFGPIVLGYLGTPEAEPLPWHRSQRRADPAATGDSLRSAGNAAGPEGPPPGPHRTGGDASDAH